MNARADSYSTKHDADRAWHQRNMCRAAVYYLRDPTVGSWPQWRVMRAQLIDGPFLIQLQLSLRSSLVLREDALECATAWYPKTSFKRLLGDRFVYTFRPSSDGLVGKWQF